MRVLAARRVVVHTDNARRREHSTYLLRHALRADKALLNVRALAFGTQVEHSVSALAVMAFEHVFVLMVHERNVAILALGDITALFAHDVRAVAATVKEQYRLIARL